MDEVLGPRSSELRVMSDEDIQDCSLVCELEEFDRHEMAVQSSSVNRSGAPIKRKRGEGSRSSSDEKVMDDEKGFILVQKRNKKPKQNAENDVNSRRYNGRRNTKSVPNLDPIEVCVSSNELLPKQIGLAKLLKSENIPNITEIKYKTPYKVFMRFETRADAEKLISNRKLAELGYKCRFTNEVSFTYGLVRYIEKEIEEEELLKSFRGESEIVAVKRLRRMDEAGTWSECETVRICFKSPTLPQYIYGYDCRFKIEPYTFPVNQCSVCWKFGHLARMCPSSKKKCPKCSGEHENCETTHLKCINCKGNHMAFDKKCPNFIKEKKIRQIMCDQNCTYKVAFAKFLDNKKAYYVREDTPLPDDNESQNATSQKTVVTKALIHNVWSKLSENDSMDCSDDDKNSNEGSERLGSIRQLKKIKKKTKKKSHQENKMQSEEQKKTLEKSNGVVPPSEEKEQRSKKRDDNKEQEKERSSDKFSFILSKLQSILLASSSFEEKIKLIIKFLIDEALKFLVGLVSNGEIIRKLINLLHHG